jgi:hypothetical protein
MANVIATLDSFGKLALVSNFTHSDDTHSIILRVGHATFYFSPAEAREVARRLVAECDQIEAEEIANGK